MTALWNLPNSLSPVNKFTIVNSAYVTALSVSAVISNTIEELEFTDFFLIFSRVIFCGMTNFSELLMKKVFVASFIEMY